MGPAETGQFEVERSADAFFQRRRGSHVSLIRLRRPPVKRTRRLCQTPPNESGSATTYC